MCHVHNLCITSTNCLILVSTKMCTYFPRQQLCMYYYNRASDANFSISSREADFLILNELGYDNKNACKTATFQDILICVMQLLFNLHIKQSEVSNLTNTIIFSIESEKSQKSLKEMVHKCHWVLLKMFEKLKYLEKGIYCGRNTFNRIKIDKTAEFFPWNYEIKQKSWKVTSVKDSQVKKFELTRFPLT